MVGSIMCDDGRHDWVDTHVAVDGERIFHCNRIGCRATKTEASWFGRIENELQAIARGHRVGVAHWGPQPTRLNERTNTMVKRLKYATEFYISRPVSPYSAMRLFARWRDPETGIINDGVVSELREAS